MASPLSAASAYANIAKLATGTVKPPGATAGADKDIGSFGGDALEATGDAVTLCPNHGTSTLKDA